MPFEFSSAPVPKIAVIGAGISGMGVAHLLSKSRHVTLFESSKRLGGHARTVVAGRHGDQPVDTGFIVRGFNYKTYPRLTQMFAALDVPVVKSNMSFGIFQRGGCGTSDVIGVSIMADLDHICGQTYHGRHGATPNSFRYGVDYVLTDLAEQNLPLLFSRNRFNLTSVHDVDHGGVRGAGRGADWVHEVLQDFGAPDFPNGGGFCWRSQGS